MAYIPKLSGIQLILLTTACQRADGSLLPPSDYIVEQGTRIGKTVTALLKHGLVEEVDAIDAAHTWREDGGRRIGVGADSSFRRQSGAR